MIPVGLFTQVLLTGARNAGELIGMAGGRAGRNVRLHSLWGVCPGVSDGGLVVPSKIP